MDETNIKYTINKAYIETKYEHLKNLEMQIEKASDNLDDLESSLDIKSLIPKIFVLSVGSHFEKEVTIILKNIFQHLSHNNSVIQYCLESKGRRFESCRGHHCNADTARNCGVFFIFRGINVNLIRGIFGEKYFNYLIFVNNKVK